jgi:hypothetical protein
MRDLLETAGNGTNAYINLNYTLGTDNVNYALNSGSAGFYCRSDVNEAAYDMGCHTNHTTIDGSVLALYSYGLYGSVNCPNVSAGTVTDTRGMWVVSRTASDDIDFYRNGNTFVQGTTASGSIYSGDAYLLARNVGYASHHSTKQMSFAYYSSGLTAAEVNTLSDIVNAYMTALGKNVYSQSTEPPPPGDILNNNPGFEDGTFINEWKIAFQNVDDSVLEVRSDDPYNGTYYLYNAHRYVTGSTHNRSELISDTDFGGTYTGYFPWYTEFWMGFAIKLPNWNDIIGNLPNEAEPEATSSWNSCFQMHSIPGDWRWNVCAAAPNVFSLVAETGIFNWSYVNEKHWSVHSRDFIKRSLDPYGSIPDFGIEAGMPRPPYWIPLADAEDKWIEVMFNYMMSPGPHATLNPGVPTGFLKVWIDKEFVVNEVGPNVYYYDRCEDIPAVAEGLLQLGSYKAQSNTNFVSQQYDDIKFADDTGTVHVVTPKTISNPIPVDAEIGNIDNTSLRITFSSSLVSGNVDGTFQLYDITEANKVYDDTASEITLSSPTIVNGVLDCTTSTAITSGKVLQFKYTNSGTNPLQDESAAEVQTTQTHTSFNKFGIPVVNNV